MTTNESRREPIRKKIYTLFNPSGYPNNLDDFEIFFLHYLKKHGCSELRRLKGRTSVADYIMTSGSSIGAIDVIVEHKRRYINHDKYETAMIELEKYSNLMALSRLLNSPVLYVNTYEDCVVCFRLDQQKVYRDGILSAPVEFGSDVRENKEVYHLMFDDTIIISKLNYQKYDRTKKN